MHPLLVAAFPVIFLFAQNTNDQPSLSPLWAPLLVAVGGAALVSLVVLGMSRAVGASLQRAALALSLVIGLVMTYGHAWNLVGDGLRLHRYLLAGWALLAVLGLVLIWRSSPAAVRRATVGVTVAVGALIVVNLVPIGGLAIRSVSVGTPEAGDGAPTEAADGGMRDVWYIVPDRYAGADGLRQAHGSDNTPFLDALRERGFQVAEHATSTYLKTSLSLLSTLNLEELDLETLEAEATGGDALDQSTAASRSHTPSGATCTTAAIATCTSGASAGQRPATRPPTRSSSTPRRPSSARSLRTRRSCERSNVWRRRHSHRGSRSSMRPRPTSSCAR